LNVFTNFANQLPIGGSFLDVGGGVGTWVDILLKVKPEIKFHQISFLEPSADMCEYIKMKYPDIKVYNECLENYYPKNDKYDNLLAAALIEHFTDPLLSLVQMNQLLKPGGKLMLLTSALNEYSFINGVERFFKFVHTFYYTMETIASLLDKTGYKVETGEICPHNQSEIIWFPTILIIAKKVNELETKDIELIRKANVFDRNNALKTKELFERINPHLRMDKPKETKLMMSIKKWLG
jgi:SAM-dependent methyltransferase